MNCSMLSAEKQKQMYYVELSSMLVGIAGDKARCLSTIVWPIVELRAVCNLSSALIRLDTRVRLRPTVACL